MKNGVLLKVNYTRIHGTSIYLSGSGLLDVDAYYLDLWPVSVHGIRLFRAVMDVGKESEVRWF